MIETKITDNFLEEADFNTLQEVMFDANFGWFLNDFVVTDQERTENLHDYQLTHTFYHGSKVNSGFYDLIQPVWDILKPKAVIRVKANLVPHTSEIIEHGWHTDISDMECKTAVLYMNTNDGYTVFKESGEKVESVANRFVEFDSTLEHSGSTCTNSKVRVVINFNYL